ncbi:hypothetical protein FOWG_16977 [Fusarium oxysporum f. sp. lycopersici MN25]|nr:hypothetical protein FOWG_16977 [Fusarium oxysporum f. sp. lycopersici MN25]
MEEDALPPHGPVTCAEERIVESVPHLVQQDDLFELPIDNKVWYAHIMHRDMNCSKFSTWKMPSVYTVGSLPDGNFVVVVTSRIRQKFNDILGQYVLDEAETGDGVFLDIFTPNDEDIIKYGLEAAKMKTRHDVLGRAVYDITYTGRPLYDFYKKIIPVTSDRLPLEWALLGYHLKVSEPEVRDQLTLLSLLLELHFVEDLNSDDVSQLLKKTQPDRWEEYLMLKASFALISVVQNTDQEMHEILLVYRLLKYSRHQAQHDLPEISHQQEERTITDTCRILGRVLRWDLMAEHEGDSERPNRLHMRRQIPRPLGLHEVQERFIQAGYSNSDISELWVNLPTFLPIRIPVTYGET